jgi:cytochrome P450
VIGMSLATGRHVDDLPVMGEIDAPDFGVDFRWVTDDLFARDYKGLMRTSRGDLVAYRNADIEALVAHPHVSHQTMETQIAPFRPPGGSDDFGIARYMRASMFTSRPPDHAALKKLTTRPLTPRSVARYREGFSGVVRRLINEALDRGEIEFVSDFVKPSLVEFWGAALGLSPEEANHAIDVAAAFMLSFRVNLNEQQINAANRGGDEYMEIMSAWIARAERSGDYPLVADLAVQHATLNERMRTQRAESYLASGLTDGFHTLIAILASCVFALVEAGIQPAAQLDPVSFAPSAFDEAARIHSAVTFTQRQATEDFVHDEVLIPRDTNINMMWLFSNRDPEVFDEPTEYRRDRPNRSKQFTFGGGPYVCAGRNLAKALGEILLSELVRGSVTIELAGDPEWVPGSFFHALQTLPVAISHA